MIKISRVTSTIPVKHDRPELLETPVAVAVKSKSSNSQVDEGKLDVWNCGLSRIKKEQRARHGSKS